MASNYSANQYDNAFLPSRIINWEVPKPSPKPYPSAQTGYTNAIATDRGYLMEESRRSQENPWGNFVGTWNLPVQIPGSKVRVATARDPCAQQALIQSAEKSEKVMSGKVKNLQRLDMQQKGPPRGASNTRSMDPKPKTQTPYVQENVPYGSATPLGFVDPTMTCRSPETRCVEGAEGSPMQRSPPGSGRAAPSPHGEETPREQAEPACTPPQEYYCPAEENM